MKIALVHDYLIDYGGAERVLSELHKIYPDAPIYVSIYRKRGLGKFATEFKDAKIIESWFGYLPLADKIISPLRFLLPQVWSSFNFSKYDVIITSASWAVTKGLATGKTKEVCYLHTPPRYLYGYDTSRNWQGKWFANLVQMYALIVNHFMRQYDFKQAQKVDYFLVNSKNVGRRLEKFYRRIDYKVVYPPVDVERFLAKENISENEKNYYLTGGRMVAAKNFDLIIKACKKANVKLKIFGTGIEEGNLRKIADNNVEFVGRVNDEEQINLYKYAKAFIVAQKDEDFGITPVEAAASGCPTIAYKGGGYEETVVEDVTGIFFEDLTVDNLASAITRFEKIKHKFDTKMMIKHAMKFSKENFQKQMSEFVDKIKK